MSEHATVLTTELARYLAGLAAQEDDFLRDLRHQSAAAGIPPIGIAPEQATMIQILLRFGGAARVLEIGTLAGYSAIAMARALQPPAELHSIEINADYADFAQKWVARSEVADRITIHRGNAVELITTFDTASFDAVFIDADKTPSIHYLEQAKRVVRSGGLVLIDNAFAYGELLAESPARKDDVWAIQKFNEFIARDDALTSVILPTGDGMWVAIRE
ncbi:MAG: O-methyltransferase [Planctomycetota bacterium]